ncbi:MAG TPA: XdhC/CoxI family protein [Pyrinomonadaceae bacterium]|jgi:xanthine dehydrogenase accessory factor|nr:XdhC/CoxI family protein [Pyrinomonadaceae bacterium]
MNDAGEQPAARPTDEHRQNSPSALAGAIGEVLRDGSLAALATLVESPRGVGAKMLVRADGAPFGSLGDAALDESVAARALSFLSSHHEASTERVGEFAPALEEWRAARVMFERVEPEPHVVVCGAGHVGAALARLARAVGYRATLIDDRADFVTRGRFPDAGLALVAATGGWARAVAQAVGAGRGVSVAVVTRGHNEDEECLRAVLAARPDYVGMIGSRRRTNIVLERLRGSGFPEDSLREVRAPVGLDIGAVSPEEVALSILAEIVAERRGGTCAPLSSWRRA